MRRGIAAVALGLAACGAAAPAAPGAPPAVAARSADAEACLRFDDDPWGAAALLDQLTPAADPPPRRRPDHVRLRGMDAATVLLSVCADDGWSRAAIGCALDAHDADAMARCGPRLTAAQRAHFAAVWRRWRAEPPGEFTTTSSGIAACDAYVTVFRRYYDRCPSAGPDDLAGLLIDQQDWALLASPRVPAAGRRRAAVYCDAQVRALRQTAADARCVL